MAAGIGISEASVIVSRWLVDRRLEAYRVAVTGKCFDYDELGL